MWAAVVKGYKVFSDYKQLNLPDEPYWLICMRKNGSFILKTISFNNEMKDISFQFTKSPEISIINNDSNYILFLSSFYINQMSIGDSLAKLGQELQKKEMLLDYPSRAMSNNQDKRINEGENSMPAKYLRRDETKARFWLKRAADRGDMDAKLLLSTLGH